MRAGAAAFLVTCVAALPARAGTLIDCARAYDAWKHDPADAARAKACAARCQGTTPAYVNQCRLAAARAAWAGRSPDVTRARRCVEACVALPGAATRACAAQVEAFAACAEAQHAWRARPLDAARAKRCAAACEDLDTGRARACEVGHARAKRCAAAERAARDDAGRAEACTEACGGVDSGAVARCRAAAAASRAQEAAISRAPTTPPARRPPVSPVPATSPARRPPVPPPAVSSGRLRITARGAAGPLALPVFIDGTARGQTPWKAELPPGPHRVHVADYEMTARVGAEQTAALDLIEETAYDRTIPYVIFGAGGVLAATGVVFGALSASNERSLRDEPHTPARYDQIESRARAQATTANVFLGAGALVIAGGAVWWLLDAGAPVLVPAPGGAAVGLRL